MSASANLLEVRNLVAGYLPDLPILNQVTLSLPENKVVVIIGPNGAGKSTLFKAIAGLVPTSSGTVTLRGRDITGVKTDKLGALGIAYVPQTDNVFRSLTIRQNLSLVLRKVKNVRNRLDRLFEIFPALRDKAADPAGTLSGGQRQMLALSMALAREPSVILLDEPSAGLSPKAAAEVLQLAGRLTAQDVSVLLVEQNVKQALQYADHCYILAEGRNQLDGPAEKLASDPVVGEIYLGGRRVNPA